MKILNLTKRKIFHLIIISIVCFICLNVYQIARHKIGYVDKIEHEHPIKENFGNVQSDDKMLSNDFMIKLSKERINTLFTILLEKEARYKNVFEELDLIMFSNFMNVTHDLKKDYKFYKEINNYFTISDKTVLVNDDFVEDLKYISNYYSYLKPRDFVVPKDISPDKKPVIVTAANSDYYFPLQATVFHIHKYFPDYELIIYDLGLDSSQLDKTKEKCKCTIRRFDEKGQYSRLSSHVRDLKTYSWKPIIIQEVLKDHDLILYMDSSIRITNNKLNPILDTVSQTGLLTQFIGLKLNCYTNPKMFEWFHETDSLYTNMDTIEANFLIMKRNFLNALIMKAWITCALDRNCIAPEDSRISGCCGCHRFDQDALTIITTYFYGHPSDNKKYLPLHGFTKNESYFFNIRRNEGMSYFDGNPA